MASPCINKKKKIASNANFFDVPQAYVLYARDDGTHLRRYHERETSMIEQQMLIGGQVAQASNGATFERKNPLDGSVATRAPAATAASMTELASDVSLSTIARLLRTWYFPGQLRPFAHVSCRVML